MPFVGAIFGALGGAFGGGGLFGGIFGKLFGGLLKSFVSKALGGLAGGGGGGSVKQQSRTLSVKQAITSKKIVYGRTKISGPIVLFEAEGGKKDRQFLHMIIPVAAHEIQAFETIYFDQAPLILNSEGECLGSGPFVGTWQDGVVTLTDPNSAVLTEAEAGQDVSMKSAFVLSGENSVTAAILSATSNVVTVNETNIQDLNLAVGDEVSLKKNEVAMDDASTVSSIAGGVVSFATNTFATDELSAGDGVLFTKKVDSSKSKTVEIASVDKDAGTVTFTDPSKYSNGTTVWASKLDGKDLTGARYQGECRVKLHLGTDSQSADADAVAEISGWTSDHKLSGIAYMYLRFKHDQKAYPNGLPNPSAVILGKKVYDTRTATTAFSANPAMCLRDYLLDTRLGMGEVWSSADMDDASFNAAANVCDEDIPLTVGTENRYECHGVVDTEDKPEQIIGKLLSSMSGTLTNVGGTWKAYAGEYTAPTLELDESHVFGTLDIQTRLGRRELFNGVKGVYINEANFWQESDYPSVTNATYVSADGGNKIWNDYSLPFTTSSAMATRLAKIELQKVRQPVTVTGVFSPVALQLEPNDTVMLTNAQLGWTQKVFQVQELKWSQITDEESLPYLGVELELRETASSVYDWDFSADEVIIDAAPNTSLDTVFEVTTPVITSAASGTSQLEIGGDGTVTSRVLLTLTPPTDKFVINGGLLEVQKKKEGEPVWSAAGTVTGASSTVYVSNIIDGALYSFRARYINSIGSNSPWSTELGHRVTGKSAPPGNVASFTALQNGALTSFAWSKVLDADLAGYEIRYGPQGSALWQNGNLLVSKKAGNSDTSAIVPPGDHTFMIKAVDTSGNYSVNATKISLTVTNTHVLDTTLTLDEYAETGTNVNLEVHPSNALILISDQSADSSLDIFDESLLTYSNVGTHTLPEVDLGSDTLVRVWANITANLLPGVTTGAAQPELLLRYRVDGEDFVETSLEDLNFLEASGAIFNNCLLHPSGVLVPESQDLASVDGIMDEFVKNAYTDWEFTSPEIDLGGDTSIALDIDAVSSLGPGETGIANFTVELSVKADGGSYGAFASFTGGRVNARYLKFKLKSNSGTGKSVINNITLEVDDFQVWTVGDITARYFQARIKIDPTVGAMSVQDYLITLDTET